jgi:beta-lactamase regulating signal transducer with metallopeptidase domain
MTDTLTLWLGERLLIGSIQGAMVIALVWLACRLAPRIPAAAQAALWWLAALKLLLVFVPAPAVPVAILPADFARSTAIGLPAPSGTTDVVSAPSASAPASAAADGGASVSILGAWLPAAVVLWAVLVLVQAVRLISAHRVLRGIVCRAVVWTSEETAHLATRLGLPRIPRVLISEEIDTPQVCGLWTPVVLLPADALNTFTADERSMTLCHELMHIRRRDLAFGWIPACAERLFFFHPLARVAAREYVAARESACDAGAVRALGVSAADYGRLLVRLGIGNARPALSAGGSPFSASSLKRRLHMLERDGNSNVSRRWGWAIALAAAALIPIQLVARTPAQAPQEAVKQRELVEAALAVERAQAEIERAQAAQAKAALVMQLEQKLAKAAARDLESKVAEQDGAQVQRQLYMEQLQRAQERLRRAEGDAAAADQNAPRPVTKATVQEYFERARRAVQEANAARTQEQLANELRKMAEALELKRGLTQHLTKEELTAQIQRLSRRLEELAVEQRLLTERLQQLQQQASEK